MHNLTPLSQLLLDQSAGVLCATVSSLVYLVCFGALDTHQHTTTRVNRWLCEFACSHISPSAHLLEAQSPGAAVSPHGAEMLTLDVEQCLVHTISVEKQDIEPVEQQPL